MNIKKRIKIVLFIILVLNLYKLSISEVIHASCEASLTYKPNLVVAKVVSRELNCDIEGSVITFKKQLAVKGNVEDTFRIVTYAKECSRREPVVNNSATIIIPPSYLWAREKTLPDFTEDKLYLLSLNRYESGEVVTDQYIIPDCDRITKEIKGIYNPKVFINLIKVWTMPIWRGSFLLIIFIDILILRFFPFLEDFSLLAILLSTIFGIGIYCIVFYSLIRVIKRLKKLL